MGRNREKFKRWPKGWAKGPSRKDGSFDIYFRPTNGGDRAIVKAITGGPLSLRLGASADQASETFARLVVAARQREEAAAPGTVAEICDRARREFLPSIENAKTREERERHVERLEKLFGTRRYARNVYEASRDTAGLYLRAMDIQRHLFEARAARPVGANREVRTWELAFTWARAPWGLTEYNPCAGLQANPEVPRLVVPEDKGIAKLYRRLEPPARFLVFMIRYYGRRKVETLGLNLGDAHEDGLHLLRGKRAKEIVLRWDPRLRRAWARLMRWREEVKRGGKVEELHAAILNGRGRRYTVTAFNSARKRAMKRAGIEGAFTFHDIRKRRADTLPTLAAAAHVLAHDDQRTTAAKYRVGPHVIDLTEEANSRKVGANSRKV